MKGEKQGRESAVHPPRRVDERPVHLDDRADPEQQQRLGDHEAGVGHRDEEVLVHVQDAGPRPERAGQAQLGPHRPDEQADRRPDAHPRR